MTYTVEQARKIYAMGLVPAVDAGFDPWAALKIVQNAAVAERDERASANMDKIWVGKTVSDGKLGVIESIDGNRVKLRGYLAKRSAHIADLSEWSFRHE
ncbi:hypothetical protein [Microcystis phage Mwe-JY13]